MVLEISQYLENYLWPNFDPAKASFAHVMSIILMVNEKEQLKKRLNARIQYAKFLQDTVGEMARELKSSRSGELQKKASELDQFMGKVRTGSNVTNDGILGFAKLFNDELTLDNLSRSRLVSRFCRFCSEVVDTS